MHVRAHPLKSAMYHGKVRTDCFVFIPPYLSIVMEDLDLTNQEHWKYLSWGSLRLNMPFECTMSPRADNTGVRGVAGMQGYPYIAEYWPYKQSATMCCVGEKLIRVYTKNPLETLPCSLPQLSTNTSQHCNSKDVCLCYRD